MRTEPGPNRRWLLGRLGVLGAGLGVAWLLRDRVLQPTPQVAFVAGAASSGWLPIPKRGGLVELPAHVAGEPIRVVVDSGAQFSAIDRGLAERLGLKHGLGLPIMAFGVSGQPSVAQTVDLDLDLGPMQVRGVRAAALELHALSGAMGRPFSMLVGRDVLRAATVDLDFPRARAAFWRPDVWRPAPNAVAATVRRSAGALLAKVSVEGREPIEAMIDTGATSALALSAQTAQSLGLLDGRSIRSGRSVSLGGVGVDRVVTAQTVAFAGHVIEDVEVQVFEPSLKGPLPAGLLGVGVLSRFRVALDHAGGRLWLSGP